MSPAKTDEPIEKLFSTDSGELKEPPRIRLGTVLDPTGKGGTFFGGDTTYACCGSVPPVNILNAVRKGQHKAALRISLLAS